VTKKDIVRTIADQIGLPQLRTKELVQKTFEALIEALVRDERVELRNFGVFQIKRREARMARNPRTGERVPVVAKKRGDVQAGQGNGGPRQTARSGRGCEDRPACREHAAGVSGRISVGESGTGSFAGGALIAGNLGCLGRISSSRYENRRRGNGLPSAISPPERVRSGDRLDGSACGSGIRVRVRRGESPQEIRS